MDYSIIKNYRMPGEYEPHDGCIMIWPVRQGSWPYNGRDAKKAFMEVAKAIAKSEKVYMLADESHIEEVQNSLKENMEAVPIESDDAWARDVGPTYVIDDKGHRIGINWKFNAWGGSFDGLYMHYDKDDKVASEFLKYAGDNIFDAHPFVLEGGSIHSDGQGTILTTEACLLSKGRNPSMAKNEIEDVLLKTLGGRKVLWLPCGIYNDETNEHVDNICAFTRPGRVVLAWTDDKNDPQYEMSRRCEEYLLQQKDAMGRTIEIVKLPVPSKPVLVKEDDLKGYVFEEGEDVREAGERLAASYVNFYIANKSVIVPQFGDVNDEIAVNILQKEFPGRTVCPVKADVILLGGGNIHCITQQIPKGGKE